MWDVGPFKLHGVGSGLRVCRGLGVEGFRFLPIVSIVVPFLGYPVLWLGSYNGDFG